jgi:hypothetical protein
MIFRFINLRVFLLSLVVGTLFVYLSTPAPNIVYVYPTPDNVNKVEYVDKADNCFKFKAIETDCALHKDKIKEIPIQN